MHSLDVAWFGWTLRGDPKPAFLKDKVSYFTLGENLWKHRPSIDAVATRNVTLWLDPAEASAARASEPGHLAETAPRRTSSRSYVNDPADFSKLELGSWFSGAWVLSTREVEALSGDGLVFETSPRTAPLTLSGRPNLKLKITLDTPDVDLRARLFVIRPDRTSILISEDRLRARYRTSLERAETVPSGKPLDYVFDRFSFTSYRLAVGERLRLVVDTPSTAFDARNFNAGGDVTSETVADARRATVKVQFGLSSGSTLSLPVE